MLHLRLYKLTCSNSVYSGTSLFFLREVAFLVVCPFRCSSSSSCCQIHWIVTQLLHLLCCYMTAFIGTKSPIGLKWSLFLNGRSSGSSRRYTLRIPLEERGRASRHVRITLHTDTPPKGIEEISQLSLKKAVLVEDPSLWFCKGLTRPLSWQEIHFKKQLLKEFPLFVCYQSESQFAAPVVNIHLHAGTACLHVPISFQPVGTNAEESARLYYWEVTLSVCKCCCC